MIFNVPIEPLEERYSTQWQRWFEREFKERGVEFKTIHGTSLTNKIKQGAFLDVISTNHYKASQLQALCSLFQDKVIKDGDSIFFHDFWFPGLEMLAYMRDALEIDVKIYGCLHAGTYDPHDFLSKKGMGTWGKSLEESWFAIVDKIFVATRFHKSLILTSRACEESKIRVTGFPIYTEDFIRQDRLKENIVVFPHRLDSEKNPDVFDDFAHWYKWTGKLSGWQFIKTKDVCKTKDEYYDLLARARIAVSFADQETWGIAMQEALFNGAIPIVPNRLSYSEMYHTSLLYTSYADFRNKLSCAIDGSEEMEVGALLTKTHLLYLGRNAIRNMLIEMGCLYGCG